MIKFVGGAAPLHHHSSDHYGTVVAGTIVLTVDGQDKKLPAGSYSADVLRALLGSGPLPAERHDS